MASALSRLVTLASAPIIACASLAFAPMAHADDGNPPPVSPGQTVLRDGLSAATAAASCWDIKQRDPNSQDGHLLAPRPPAMDAPAQFFCDQTTDGGGWVMIGRGREGWEPWSGGNGDPAKLTTRERNQSASTSFSSPTTLSTACSTMKTSRTSRTACASCARGAPRAAPTRSWT